ncbi:MAG: class I SAM-dependent methyltransferase [Candidatus Thorarchaeota archaeon]
MCCGSFYNNPVVIELLDGIFHPGGLALSRLMAERMGLDAHSSVIDIACGNGRTATYLAKSLRCRVSGIDASPEMIESAKQLARDLGIEDRTDFAVALASEVPYGANSFTAALSECALCTFHDKERAVREISRVLTPGGILGLNDVTVQTHEELDEELRGLLGRVACVADALSVSEYTDLFEKRGFEMATSSTHSDLLEHMARKAKGRARLLRDVGGNDSTINRMSDAMRIIGLIEEQISTGNIGYGMFIFQQK